MNTNRMIYLGCLLILCLVGGSGVVSASNETALQNYSANDTQNVSSDMYNGTAQLAAPNISGAGQNAGINQRYAKGGVKTGFDVGTMEGRGTDTNASATNAFSDHTHADGYIKAFMKSFNYVSGVNP
jgi:hypothetical protein